MATGSGVISGVFNIGFTLAEPIAEYGRAAGLSQFASTNLIWWIMLGTGAIANLGFLHLSPGQKRQHEEMQAAQGLAPARSNVNDGRAVGRQHLCVRSFCAMAWFVGNVYWLAAEPSRRSAAGQRHRDWPGGMEAGTCKCANLDVLRHCGLARGGHLTESGQRISWKGRSPEPGTCRS
jgi:hypothetical protein